MQLGRNSPNAVVTCTNLGHGVPKPHRINEKTGRNRFSLPTFATKDAELPRSTAGRLAILARGRIRGQVHELRVGLDRRLEPAEMHWHWCRRLLHRELTWFQQIEPPPHCSMLHGAMLPFIDPSRQCAAYGIWTLFQTCSAFRHVLQASPTGYRDTFTSETQYRPFPHRSDNPRAADRNHPTNPAEAVQA